MRWGLFLLALASSMYFLHVEPGWNVNSRLGLTLAIAREGRISIDSFHGDGPFATGDKAEVGGHFYSDKPIGLSVAAVPAVWFAERIAGVTGLEVTPEFTRWIARAFTVSLSLAGLLVLLSVMLESLALPRHFR